MIFYCMGCYHYNRTIKDDEQIMSTEPLVEREFDYNRYEKETEEYYSDEETGTCNQYKPKLSMKSAPKYEKKYVVAMIGRTEEGKKICVHVIGYKPYFYLGIPKDVTEYSFVKNVLEPSIDGAYCTLKTKYIEKYGKPKILSCAHKNFKSMIGYEQNIDVVSINFDNSNALNQLVWKMSKVDKFLKKSQYIVSKKGQRTNEDKKTGKDKTTIYRNSFKFDFYDEKYSKNKFFIDNKFKPVGWYEIKKYSQTTDWTTTPFEISTTCDNIKILDRSDIPPYVGLSFDIEMVPLYSEKVHPDPIIDPIICIGVVEKVGNKPMRKRIISEKFECNTKDFETIVAETQEDLLLKFREVVVRLQPDYITAYNGFVYDWPKILYQRKAILEDLVRLSIFPHLKCRVLSIEKVLVGMKNIWKYPRIPGCILYDPYVLIRYSQDDKLKEKGEGFSLKKVAMHYLNDTKDDLAYDEMYKLYFAAYIKRFGEMSVNRLYSDAKYDEKGIYTILKYCVKDCSLLHDLTEKLAYIPFWNVVAKMMNASVDDVIGEAKGVRIINIILEHAKEGGFLIPQATRVPSDHVFNKICKEDPDVWIEYNKLPEHRRKAFIKKQVAKKKIKGGLVGNPDVGIFENVCVVDINSAYPNTIIALELSPENKILDKDLDKYKDDPNVHKYKYELNDGTELYGYYYKRPGILTKIVSKGLAERKKVRRIGSDILLKIDALKKFRSRIMFNYSVDKETGRIKTKLALANVKMDLSRYISQISKKYKGPLQMRKLESTIPLRMKYVDSHPLKEGLTLSLMEKQLEKDEEFSKKEKKYQEDNQYNIMVYKNEVLGKSISFLESLLKESTTVDLDKVQYDLKIAFDKTEFEQKALKVNNNSVYGLFAMQTFVLYLQCLAGIITQFVRDYNENCTKLLCTYIPGTVKVYGDTDSVFFRINDPLYFKGMSAEEKYLRSFKYGMIGAEIINYDSIARGYPSMQVVLEKMFGRIIMNGMKKRYYGYKYEAEGGAIPPISKYKEVMMGFDFKKKSTAKIEGMIGFEIFKMMLERRFDDIVDYVREAIDAVYDGEFDQDYFVYRKRFKGLAEYANDGDRVPHVKIWKRLSEKMGDLAPQENEDITYLYKKLPPQVSVKGKIVERKKLDIAFSTLEMEPGDSIDYAIYLRQAMHYHEIMFKYFIKKKKLPKNFLEMVDMLISKYERKQMKEIQNIKKT